MLRLSLAVATDPTQGAFLHLPWALDEASLTINLTQYFVGSLLSGTRARSEHAFQVGLIVNQVFVFSLYRFEHRNYSISDFLF